MDLDKSVSTDKNFKNSLLSSFQSRVQISICSEIPFLFKIVLILDCKYKFLEDITSNGVISRLWGLGVWLGGSFFFSFHVFLDCLNFIKAMVCIPL